MDKEIIVMKIKWKIRQLKNKLSKTDYQAIKYAEGVLSASEYAPVKIQRQAWRDEINRLEAELKSLGV
jgi:hypothetical protein